MNLSVLWTLWVCQEEITKHKTGFRDRFYHDSDRIIWVQLTPPTRCCVLEEGALQCQLFFVASNKQQDHVEGSQTSSNLP